MYFEDRRSLYFDKTATGREDKSLSHSNDISNTTIDVVAIYAYFAGLETVRYLPLRTTNYTHIQKRVVMLSLRTRTPRKKES